MVYDKEVFCLLFYAMCMDGLSSWLNNSGIGCTINDTSINHLMYADDTCTLAPSATTLQKLLSICSMYAQDNSIILCYGQDRSCKSLNLL